MGYRVHVLAPDDDTPTGQVADVEVRAAYDDLDAVERFARGVSVVTFEFENVPAATAAAAAKHVPVRPSGRVLHVAQHREREKSFLQAAGLPVTPFLAVASAEEARQALAAGRPGHPPAVLKSASWGYDGKGQAVINTMDDVDRAWQAVGADACILEAFIDFAFELSVVAVRGLDDSIVTYGPMLNRHRNHILDLSVCPSASILPPVAREAIEIARATVRAIDAVGVVCIEFFLDRRDRLMINEIAPRPHNSGHLTIDAHATCQFEQQVRAICGLPLGSTRQLRPAAMANLLGDLWTATPATPPSDGSTPTASAPPSAAGATTAPDWPRGLALPDVRLHLYGKKSARAGRKMGHLTALADSGEAAAERAMEARRALTIPRSGRGGA